jgi:hypothetical protein
MTYVAPGQLRLTGVLAQKRATVMAINVETGDIGGKQIRDGKYAFIVSAEPGQELELLYQVGNDVSDSTYFNAPKLEDVQPTDAGALVPDATADTQSTSVEDDSSELVVEAGVQ